MVGGRSCFISVFKVARYGGYGVGGVACWVLSLVQIADKEKYLPVREQILICAVSFSLSVVLVSAHVPPCFRSDRQHSGVNVSAA